MKTRLIIFALCLLSLTSRGANATFGTQTILTTIPTNTHFVVTAGNASNSPVRLINESTLSNAWRNATGSGSTQMVAAAIGYLTVTGAVTQVGDGATIAYTQLYSTNNAATTLKAAADTINLTNVVGLVRRGTNNLMFDGNLVQEAVITNKLDHAASITFSNCSEGQKFLLTLTGGGTSRVITFRADTNTIIADLDAFGVALATTKAVTLTNLNGMEVSGYVTRPLSSAFGTSNILKLVTRQHTQ